MYEHKTEEQVAAEILSRLPAGMAKAEGSFAHLLAAGAASAICQAYHAADSLVSLICLEPGAPAEVIEAQAAEVGIHRSPGTKARCQMAITADPGTEIPAGSLWYTRQDIAFTAPDPGRVPNSGTLSLQLEAVEPGTAGNVPGASLVTMGQTIPGVRSAVNGAATGGTDPESDDALLERLRAHRSRPALSGNAYHYEAWATAVPGVGAARVISKVGDTGMVDVVLAGPDMGPVSKEVVEAAQNIIVDEKPVGANPSVRSAGKTEISVQATVAHVPGTDLPAIKEEFAARLKAHLATWTRQAFRQHIDADVQAVSPYKVRYNFVLDDLLNCQGVEDVSGLTLNGGPANLEIPADHAAVLGKVTLL